MNLTKDVVDTLKYRYSNVGETTEGDVIVKKGVDWLVGLSETEKLPIAILFETVAQELLAVTSDSNAAVETIAFPLIRRCYLKTNEIFDAKDYVEKLTALVKENQEVCDTFVLAMGSEEEMQILETFLDKLIGTVAVDEKLTKELQDYLEG